ncbi:MAG: STAS domain-containing protein [Bdellovibrionales bacterium]|nr:STAS domain-containing protein [Bdellovibrionales bacterium]
MKARIKNQGNTIVLYLDGKIDYETQDDVCTVINSTIARNKKDETPKSVIVNFQNLEFVGSTGITQFVHSLKAIHNENDGAPKYCGVRSEFQKIIKAFDEGNEFDFFDDEALTRKNGKPIINQ